MTTFLPSDLDAPYVLGPIAVGAQVGLHAGCGAILIDGENIYADRQGEAGCQRCGKRWRVLLRVTLVEIGK
jgi:hypothetical protein